MFKADSSRLTFSQSSTPMPSKARVPSSGSAAVAAGILPSGQSINTRSVASEGVAAYSMSTSSYPSLASYGSRSAIRRSRTMNPTPRPPGWTNKKGPCRPSNKQKAPRGGPSSIRNFHPPDPPSGAGIVGLRGQQVNPRGA